MTLGGEGGVVFVFCRGRGGEPGGADALAGASDCTRGAFSVILYTSWGLSYCLPADVAVEAAVRPERGAFT
jgi:hypothetical protein